MFSSIFRSLNGDELVRALVENAGLGEAGIIFLLLAILFFAGFVMDWVSVLLVCLPIFVPIVAAFDIDPIWFAMLVFVVLQSSYLTPPMAPSIFYLRGIAPKDMTTPQMYRGVVPFIVCMLVVLGLLLWFPALATWAPSVMVRTF